MRFSGREFRVGVVALAIAAALIAPVASGCGGGSSSSANSGSDSSGGSTSGESSSEPSKEFVGKGENGTLATVGKEASPAEREEVSEIVEESLEARADSDWETQCATLAAPLIVQLEKTAKTLGAKPGCTSALEVQANRAPESARENTMTGPIDALRVAGPQAFAFYHGTEGDDYVMPLVEEGGEWKLASLQEQKVL